MIKPIKEVQDTGGQPLRSTIVVVRNKGSQGATPVTCVQKKDNNVRVCVDCTLLNASMRLLCYPLPRIDNYP